MQQSDIDYRRKQMYNYWMTSLIFVGSGFHSLENKAMGWSLQLVLWAQGQSFFNNVHNVFL